MAEKLSITLPPEMVAAIKSRVASGEFGSTSEVLRTAMRQWLRGEEEHEARLDAVRARIRRSLDDPRPSRSADEVFDRLKAKYRAQAGASAAE